MSVLHKAQNIMNKVIYSMSILCFLQAENNLTKVLFKYITSLQKVCLVQ